MEGIPIAIIPHPLGGLRPQEVIKRAEDPIMEVIRGLKEAERPACPPKEGAGRPKGAVRHKPLFAPLSGRTIRVADSLEAINKLFYTRGLTDGLPIIPPTPERVKRMLSLTRRDPKEVIAVLPPRMGEATVEKIAVNAVMAGCYPEYMPLIIAIVKALAHPDFNLYAVQTTTHLCAPLVILNGPIAKELKINYRASVLGPGTWSNATIGRAVRLILINIGGGIPGTLDKAAFGQPAKYSYLMAENEEESPWEPLHVEHGFDKELSTVTVISAEGPHNVQDHDSKSACGILTSISGTLSTVGSNSVYFQSQTLVVMSPEHAHTVAREGMKKEDVKTFIFEHSQIPFSRFSEENVERWKRTWPERYRDAGPETLIPVASSKDDIILLVSGGAGKHSLIMPTFGLSRAVTMPLEG